MEVTINNADFSTLNSTTMEYYLYKYEQTNNPAYLWWIIQKCTEHKEKMPTKVLEYLNSVSVSLLSHDKSTLGEKLKNALQVKSRVKLKAPYELIELSERKRKIEDFMLQYEVSQHIALVAEKKNFEYSPDIRLKGGKEDKHYITKKKEVEIEALILLEKGCLTPLVKNHDEAMLSLCENLGTVLEVISHSMANAFVGILQPLTDTAKIIMASLADCAGMQLQEIIEALQDKNEDVTVKSVAQESINFIDIEMEKLK